MDIEKIKALLSQVKAPQGGTDIVSAGVVTEVEVDDGEIVVGLKFEGVDRDARHDLEDEVRNVLLREEGVREVLLETQVEDLPEPKAPAPQPGLSVHGGGSGAAAAAHAHAHDAPSKGALSAVQNIIAVASGKGGVGKSTVAVNLALALQARGARVGLCDLDIYGPSVPIQLGVAGAKPGVSSDQKRFIPVEAYGLKVMSIGFLVEDDTPVIWRGPIVASVVKQFLGDVIWGELDYLVIDMPPGTGDAQLTLTQSAPITAALIVTTPSELALVDAVKGMQMFRKVDTPVVGLVENMAHYECPECGHRSTPFNSGGTERVVERFDTRLLATIPIDPEIQLGGDTGRPVVAVKRDSPQAGAFLALADALTEHVPFDGRASDESDDKKKSGFFSGLFKR